MKDDSSSAGHRFLLFDDSALPFAAQDILMEMDDQVQNRLATVLFVCSLDKVLPILAL